MNQQQKDFINTKTEINEIIRDAILEFLYNQSLKAKSIPQRLCALSPISSHIRKLGNDEKLTAHNLSYLLDTGWVKKETETTSGKGFGGKKSVKIKIERYRITDKGINHFEQESKYKKKSFSGINITNMGGVTIVGDNNYVQTNQSELYNILDEMKSTIIQMAEVNDDIKLELKSDIDTIQAQLAKKSPIKSIVNASWTALGRLATIDGVLSLYQKADALIQKIIT